MQNKWIVLIIGACSMIGAGFFNAVGNDVWVSLKANLTGANPQEIKPIEPSIITFILVAIGIFCIGYAITRNIQDKKQVIPKEQNPELEKRAFLTKRDAKTLDWLNEVKTEVCVLAVDGGSFAESNFERIKKRINEDDVSFTFLLLNPSSDILPKIEGTLLSPKAKTGIVSQLDRFKDIRDQLGNKTSKLEIRIYDLPVVHSIFMIDPKTDNGKMTVEYYEYKTEPRDKINIILTKKNNPELFDWYYSKYKYVWEQSIPYSFT